MYISLLLQVVEGIKYSLNLKVGLATSCRNDGKVATLDECPVDPNSVRCFIIKQFGHYSHMIFFGTFRSESGTLQFG